MVVLGRNGPHGESVRASWRWFDAGELSCRPVRSDPSVDSGLYRIIPWRTTAVGRTSDATMAKPLEWIVANKTFMATNRRDDGTPFCSPRGDRAGEARASSIGREGRYELLQRPDLDHPGGPTDNRRRSCFRAISSCRTQHSENHRRRHGPRRLALIAGCRAFTKPQAPST